MDAGGLGEVIQEGNELKKIIKKKDKLCNFKQGISVIMKKVEKNVGNEG